MWNIETSFGRSKCMENYMEKRLLTLFLVDDEAITLRGLKETYNWEQMGFEVVGTALDGDIAFPMIEEIRPDVIMTDIRMKRMDGLTLMRKVKEKYPQIAFILLSAHKDFEYAQEACKNGALCYLVKPIDDAGLEQNMSRVYDQCMKKLEEKKFYERWKKLLVEDKESYLNLMTKRYLDGGISASDLKHIYDEMGEKDYLNGEFLCICADIELSYHVVKQEVYTAKRHILGRILRDTLKNKGTIITFENEDNSFLIMVRLEGEFSPISCKQIMWSLQQKLEIEIISAISNNYFGIEGMKKSYQEVLKVYEVACEASVNSLTVSRNQETGSYTQYSIDLESQILQSIRKGDVSKFKEVYKAFIYAMNDKEGRLFLHRLIVRIECVLQSMGYLTEENKNSFDNFYMILNKQSVLRLIDIAYKLTCDIIEQKKHRISKNSEHIFKDYINNALTYIDEHLGNENLSICDIAEEIHLNAAYFGRVFKKTMNMSLKKYILERRIERAKLLLCENKYTVFEVAYMVGVPNQSYFGKLFKESTGEIPSVWQEKS